MTGTTVNDAVVAYGEALIDTDTDWIPTVRALSLHETLFRRQGPWKTQRWSTQLVDARTGQLPNVGPGGRDSAAPAAWLAGRDSDWLGLIRYGVMDLSGPYRAAFDTMTPDAKVVADPFHVMNGSSDCGGG